MVVRRLVICIAALVTCGCGGPNIKLVPVHGQLLLDGKPLPQKTIRFAPEAETGGHGGGATTDQQGNFKLIALIPGSVEDFPGIAPGSYRVTVVDRMFSDDPPVQGKTNDPEVALAPSMKSADRQIPSAYSRPETTPLIVQVPNEGGQIDISLDSKFK